MLTTIGWWMKFLVTFLAGVRSDSCMISVLMVLQISYIWKHVRSSCSGKWRPSGRIVGAFLDRVTWEKNNYTMSIRTVLHCQNGASHDVQANHVKKTAFYICHSCKSKWSNASADVLPTTTCNKIWRDTKHIGRTLYDEHLPVERYKMFVVRWQMPTFLP